MRDVRERGWGTGVECGRFAGYGLWGLSVNGSGAAGWVRRGLAVVLAGLVVGGCSVEVGDPIGEIDAQVPQSSLPGVSWLGTWTGTADGTRGGAAFRQETIVLNIVRDVRQACASGFAVRLGTLFDRCVPAPDSDVSASWEYETDSTRHAISMDRFSGGGQTANVILGRVRVDRRPVAGTAVVDAEFTVVRR